MKRFLLWLVGVVLGVGIFLGAVMGVSYAFTTEGGCPDSTAQFGTEALEPNGWCWQVPLIGGKLDTAFFVDKAPACYYNSVVKMAFLCGFVAARKKYS